MNKEQHEIQLKLRILQYDEGHCQVIDLRLTLVE